MNVVVLLLILILLGVIPTSHYLEWGPYPMGGAGLVVLILVILLLTGRL